MICAHGRLTEPMVHSPMATLSNEEGLVPGPGQVPFEVFRALPKTDLHVHLDGSLRLETILELGREQGVELPAIDVPGLMRHRCGRTSVTVESCAASASRCA